MARTYKRDSRGRFAGGGGGSSRGGGRKPLQRGTNRLTRDNAGRITSVGGDGATARGGRLRTASGKQRATVTTRGIGKAPAGTVGKSGRVKAPARVKAKPNTARRDKLQSGPLAGANDSVKQGLRVMGNRAINRVATAAKLSELQKAGKLNQLSSSQSRRAQSVFNDAQRKVNVAPNIAIEQRKIQLAIKSDKQRRNLSAAQATAKPAAAAKPASNRRRRPTSEQSRAAGLTPIADIRARQAAQSASMDAGRIRRKQSNTTRARGQQVVAAQGKQRAPFGRYSTIKNPAAEGSFPQMAPGRTGQGMAQAAKGRSSHSRPSNTKAINRLNTLRRRVQYLRKDQQDFKFDKFGDRYAGPKLAKARRDLTSAIAGARGARVSIRTKSQAQGAQASRRQKLINQANSRIISTKTMQRPSSNQPNLLTGAVDRVPGRKFRSARQRPRR